MTSNEHRLTRELIAAVANLKALYGDPTVIPFNRARAREKVVTASERLEAEMAKPITVTPWTPHNARNSYKPGVCL
jgi:hypothetical protein